MEFKKQQDFFHTIYALPSHRGVDFFEGESISLLILDLLLNQRVGVERATAAALSIHYEFGDVQFNNEEISDTLYPYNNIQLRRPGKSLFNMLTVYQDKKNTKLHSLCSSEIGALASLERYYNRKNKLFDTIRKVELRADQIQGITLDMFKNITGLNFPKNNLLKQLESVACILHMKNKKVIPKRSELKVLKRVGDEMADTLLVYVFKQKALILDEYLRRILYRHGIIDDTKLSRTKIVKVVAPMISSYEESHKLHSRINEIAVLYCHSPKPNCQLCPLYKSFKPLSKIFA